MEFITYLVIGLLAGWITGVIVKGRGFGVFGDILVGIVGSLLGGLVFSLLGIASYSFLGSVLMAVAGALLFLGLASLVRREAGRSRYTLE